MWWAASVSFLAGRGAGSSSSGRPGCRRLGIGVGAFVKSAQPPVGELVAITGAEFVYGHTSVRSGDGRVGSICAHNAFDGMPYRHAKWGNGELALIRFSELRKWGTEPDEITFSFVIRECGLSNRLGMGMSLHCLMIKRGYQDQLFIASNLITMYSTCGKVELARRVFDGVTVHDAISWNSMVASYFHNGLNKEAIYMFSVVLARVHDRMVLLNNFTLSCIVRACAVWGGTRIGRLVHGFVFKMNFEWDVVVMSSLIHMYAKHHSLYSASLIFEKMGERDVIAWNSMISGYAQCSNGEVAMQLFQKMQLEGFLPNEVTFTSILSASAGLEDADLGRCLHATVTKCGYLSDSFVGTALVDMYSKCLEMEDAERAFVLLVQRNLVSFNALITGYGLMGIYEKALQAYIDVQRNGMKPDPCTFTGLLSSCSLKTLAEGSQIHCHIVKFGFDSDVLLGNSLVSFYAKCNLMEDATRAFDSIMKPNTICWAGIISCFVQNNEGEKALMYFKKMHMFSEMPDEFSLSAVFKALADLAAGEQGKHLHALVIKIGLESAVFVGSALVDMYCKCGMVEDSLKIFIIMPQKNVVSWNAIIVGLAQNGLCKKSLELFQEMVDVGITPNSITFIGVLVACNHTGLVDEGRHYFNLMVSHYEISPTVEHYTCMVDLLGRMGYSQDAEVLVNSCSFSLEPVVWRSVLASCRISGNKEIALKAFKECLLVEPQSSGTHVLLSNICASEGLWSEVLRIRNSMKEIGIRKEPGFSWIEIKNKVHVFTAEQRSGFPEDMIATLLMIHLEMRI